LSCILQRVFVFDGRDADHPPLRHRLTNHLASEHAARSRFVLIGLTEFVVRYGAAAALLNRNRSHDPHSLRRRLAIDLRPVRRGFDLADTRLRFGSCRRGGRWWSWPPGLRIGHGNAVGG